MFFSFSSAASGAASHPAADHDVHADAIRERDGVANVADAVGARHQRRALFDDGHERLERPVGLAARARGFRVRPRFVEQLRDLIEPRVALLLQILVGAIRGRAAAAEAAAAPAAERRELKGDAGRRAHGAFLVREAVEIHHRDLSAEDAAAGRGRHGGDAVGARHRNRVAVVVEGDLRAQRLVELENFVDVAVTARAGIGEAERRARVDEAGVDVGAGGVNGLRAGRDRDVGADRFDDAVANHDRPAVDWRRCDGEDLARW